MNTIFNKFNTAVDSFDFNLKRNRSQVYVLEVTAISQGKLLEKKTIVLETKDLDLAIKKALKVINKTAREITPGIEETGDLRNRTTIKLVPAESTHNQMYAQRIAPGIFMVSNEPDDFYDEYHEDDYDDDYDEDYDVDNEAEELINAFARFIRKVSR